MSMPIIPVPAGLETELFCMGSGALKYLPEVLERVFPDKPVFLVADENTWHAAGTAAEKFLLAAGLPVAGKYIFPGTPKLHPDYRYCRMLAEKFPAGCVPVAIGSGVINDLTKCGASLAGMRYCCVPTACSVDGYTAAGAALVVEGTKKTVKCPAPQALCADTDILATAPPEMLASGFADLLTKVPAGADWVIADAVGEEPIRQDVWDLIQGNIRKWVADRNDMLAIFDGLAATGYSMQMYRESRPASGAEHLFSHIWEMEGLTKDGEDVSHGFKVGVGMLASTLLMEFVLEHSFAELLDRMKDGLSVEERTAEIDELLKAGCYGDAPKTTALNKFLSGEKLSRRRKLIGDIWEKLQSGIRERLIPYPELRKILQDAGCPVTPAEIGLDVEQFRHGIKTAQLIRNRYTILDLLYELGLLDEAIAEKVSVMEK
ncbi:MAG: sn-glycerol-1-phosphate dehydrogenase [Lentisphaeria bacterium]|nr:sn-glycerol-1-phosphate dehydrogenase [Lentisphaeria bacterium]